MESQLAMKLYPQCELFSDFGWFVQVLLGIISFSSLLIKKYLDFQKRTWEVWFMDTSKQAISTAITHFLNLLLAYFFAGDEAKPCTWYFLSMFTDALLGTCLSFVLLKGLQKTLEPHKELRFFTGDYGDPPCWLRYFYQVFWWVLVVLVAKMILVGTMVVLKRQIQAVGDFVLSPLDPYPKVELLCVMIVIPVILNAFMFWVTDGFLRKDTHTTKLPLNSKPVKKYTDLA